MTPAPAPAEAPEAAAETAVVPETAVTTAVAVEPPLAAVATSVTYCQCLLWIVGEGNGRTGAEIVSD